MAEDFENETDAAMLRRALDAAKNKRLIKIADQLIGKYNFVTVNGKRDERVFYFDGKQYKTGGESLIKSQAEKELGGMANNHATNEVLGHIKRRTATQEQTPPRDLINLDNGVLNVRTLELQTHTPKNFFTWTIPVTYAPEAKCPAIIKFLKETLTSDDIKIILEFLGFCLFRQYFIKKALICVGEPDTGKTTLLTLINNFLGAENVSSQSIQRIVSDKFSAGALYGKLANIYDELPYSELANAGGFKIATGGGYLAAEVKFGDAWQFINSAKFVYACNQIPKIKDTGDMAYYSRWLIMRFSNVVTEKNKDSFLLEKLTKTEELSGLLNLALNGLAQLLKAGSFSYGLNAEDNKRIMIRNSEPIMQFVEACLVRKDGAHVPKDLIYQLYKWHAEKEKLPVVTKTALTQALSRFAPFVTLGENRIDGRIVKCYRNLRCRDFCYFLKYHEKQFIEIDVHDFFESSESSAAYIRAPFWHGRCQADGCESYDCKQLTDRAGFCVEHWGEPYLEHQRLQVEASHG